MIKNEALMHKPAFNLLFILKGTKMHEKLHFKGGFPIF